MAINSVTGEYAESVLHAACRCLAEAGLDLRRLREFETKVRQRRAYLAATAPTAEAPGEEKAEQPRQQASESAPFFLLLLRDLFSGGLGIDNLARVA